MSQIAFRPNHFIDSNQALDRQYFRDFWQYRELFCFLAWRDIKVRYKQTALGILWAIIQPLFTMLIFTVFFGALAKVPSDGVPHAVFYFSALLPWIYFSGTLANIGNSLVSNANLITKVYFPRVLLPASTALSGLLDFCIGSVLLLLLLAYYRIQPGWTLLLWPILTIPLVALSLGIGMILSALNVKYRDIKYVIPFAIQLWLFVTPIIYPASIVPARFRLLLALNPLTGIIQAFRYTLLPGRSLDWRETAVSGIITGVVFVSALLYFRKTEREFADIV